MNETRARWEISVRSLLKILIAMVIIMSVIVVVLMIQVGYRNSTVTKVRVSVNKMEAILDEFKASADAAKNDSTRVDNAAVARALVQINRNSGTLSEIKVSLQDLITQLRENQ